MLEPGASSDMNVAMSVKYETTSALSVDPTLTAVEIQPGLVSDVVDDELPAATTVAMPIDRKLSIAGLYGWLSQGAAYKPPPRLMFTDAMLYCGATVYTRSSPATMSEVYAPRHGAMPPQLSKLSISEKTCTAISFAFFATPENGTPPVAPLPVAMPATCVPWRQSPSEHGAAAPGPNCCAWPFGHPD